MTSPISCSAVCPCPIWCTQDLVMNFEAFVWSMTLFFTKTWSYNFCSDYLRRYSGQQLLLFFFVVFKSFQMMRMIHMLLQVMYGTDSAFVLGIRTVFGCRLYRSQDRTLFTRFSFISCRTVVLHYWIRDNLQFADCRTRKFAWLCAIDVAITICNCLLVVAMVYSWNVKVSS